MRTGMKNMVRFYNIVDALMLVAIKPASVSYYEEMERQYGLFHLSNDLTVIISYGSLKFCSTRHQTFRS